MKKLLMNVALVLASMTMPTTMLAHPGHVAVPKVEVPDSVKTLHSQWAGKKVAFLGDSMTDPKSSATEAWYWQYLKELLGIDYYVYARSGYQWDRILDKAKEMNQDLGADVDAILIWAGTNDYNHNIPIGKFFTETVETVNFNGQMVQRKHRTLIMTDSTFCGRINKVMDYLKTNYPDQQIIIMTPIHRAFATFSSKNVQPDENYANSEGLYLETYIQTLKEAATLWAVPVIDLHAASGLYPLKDGFAPYFHHSDTDRLHPSAEGHYRLARTLQYQLLTLPATFRH